MTRLLRAVGVIAAAWSLSTGALAQTLPTSIVGVVRDSSGGVMPGVTVEASSPALIEKVRTAVTDEHGEYKIIDLRPGTYSVTFALTGFSVIKREALELQSGFAAKIDAEMKVGTLEETLTVSGQSPVVDVQNTSQIKTVSSEMLFALPITKEMGGLAKVTVGVMIPPTAQDVGGNIDPMNAYPVIHGGRTADNRALLDGMQFNGEGQGRGFYFNPAAAQEASMQLGGQTAGRPELPAAGKMEPHRHVESVLRGGRFDAYLQLAEPAQGRRHRHLDPEREHRLSLQRAARLAARSARRQPVESAGVAQLRHRIARVQGRLHDTRSVAPCLV